MKISLCIILLKDFIDPKKNGCCLRNKMHSLHTPQHMVLYNVLDNIKANLTLTKLDLAISVPNRLRLRKIISELKL